MKSLLDIINGLGGGESGHTRRIDICSGIAYNSNYTSENDDSTMSTILDVNGSGKILAVVPYSTNGSYYGEIKVYLDNQKIFSSNNYYYNNYAYPSLVSKEFWEFIDQNRMLSAQYNTVGFYLPQVKHAMYLYQNSNNYGVHKTPYSKEYHSNNFVNQDTSYWAPTHIDTSDGATDSKFNKNLKIVASQTGGTGYVDNYTYIMVIYDLNN